MFLQCWVGVKKCEFWLHSRFPMSPLNGRKKRLTWGVDQNSLKAGCVSSVQVNCGVCFNHRGLPCISQSHPLLPLSPAHFLYLFKKLPFSSPSISCVRVVESKLISRFASPLSQSLRTDTIDGHGFLNHVELRLLRVAFWKRLNVGVG